jgi:hypothetical protein
MNYVKSTLKEGLNRRWIVDIAGRGLPTVGRRAGERHCVVGRVSFNSRISTY